MSSNTSFAILVFTLSVILLKIIRAENERAAIEINFGFKLGGQSNTGSTRAAASPSLNTKGIDILNGVRPNKPIIILVDKIKVSNFTDIAAQKNIPHKVIIMNVETILIQKTNTMSISRSGDAMDWKSYPKANDVNKFMDDLASQHSDVATVINIGKSYEGRDLKLIKIGFNPSSDCAKNSYFIEAGMKAREWAGITTATYIINELITNKEKHRGLLENMDFYILPLLNPDGYEYSMADPKNRLWKKNRSKPSDKPDCIGADLDSNFCYEYGGVGTSDDPCEATYRGPYNFSEPESRAVKDFIKKKKYDVNWHVLTSIGSYGQSVLIPWYYSKEKKPEVYPELETMARQAADAIKGVHGKEYQVANAAAHEGEHAGGIVDWAIGRKFFKHSLAIKVRPEDDAKESNPEKKLGHLLSEDQILPTAQEVFAGILKIAAHCSVEAKK